MSWYSSSWKFRAPIVIDKLSAGVTAEDVTATIPPDFSEFWDNVLPSGNDIRVTDQDGITLETYDIAAGFDTATRTGVIEVDGWTPAAAQSMGVLWLYWGNSVASDARTPFAPAAPRTGYIYPGRPGVPAFKAGAEEPGASRPRQKFAYTATETVLPWLDVSALMTYRSEPYQGRLLYEEIAYIQLASLNSGAADQAGERTLTNIRMFDAFWVRGHLTAGTTQTNRAVSFTIGTTLSRVLNPRIMAQCISPLAP